MTVEAAIARHERIALQVSGGRDSLACLYLLREFWPRLTVYWANTGDPYPETVARMNRVRAEVPRFVEIMGRQPEVVREFGLPTDLVPIASTQFGVMAAGSGILLQDRYSCCQRSWMLPLHARMIEDGITLIIRGQRNEEALKSPLRSGAQLDGFEFLFPLEEWTAEDVMAFLDREGIAPPRFYDILSSAPDCLSCSAYWEEGVSRYLDRHHPTALTEYRRRLGIIREAVRASEDAFNREFT